MKQEMVKEYLPKLGERIGATLGTVIEAEEVARGVYYFVVKNRGEYYVADKDNSILSNAAIQYGKSVDELPGFLLYPFEEEHSGSTVVGYEIERYAASQTPGRDGQILRELAAYGREGYPEYFGDFPVPVFTPWGTTVRHSSIDNGIIWVETDRCEQGLAVCYPVWASDLSKSTVAKGEQTEYDQEQGIDSTFGYLFFTKQNACLALFELLATRSTWKDNPHLHIPALMNAICQYHPEYAVSYNAREQLGLNDWLGLFLQELGVDVKSRRDRVISMFPDAGVEYLSDPAAMRQT